MEKIIHQDGKEVRVFVTPEGVTGIVATSISLAAVNGLVEKLAKRIDARQNIAAEQAPCGQPASASNNR